MGYRFATFVLSLIFVLSSQAYAQSVQSMQEYRWQNRLLLLHPNNEAALSLLTDLIDEHQAEIEERKLQIFVTWRNRLLALPEIEHKVKATDVLRMLVTHQANMVLIGLDGGIKHQSEQIPPNFEQLFTLIDGMPMRQSELNQSSVNSSQ